MIRYILSSDLAEAEQLRAVVDAIAERFGKRRPADYLRVGRGPVAGMDDALQTFVRRLPDAGCFRFDKHPRLEDFELDNSYLIDDATHDPAYAARREWFARHGASVRRAIFGVATVGPGKPKLDLKRRDTAEYSDHRLVVRLGGPQEPSFGWSIHDRKGDDRAAHREFFRTCFHACDLHRDMMITESEQGFSIKSERHALRFGSSKWGGFDPTSVSIAVPDLTVAWNWLDRTIAELGANVIETSLNVACQDDQYTAHRAAWNALGGDWDL